MCESIHICTCAHGTASISTHKESIPTSEAEDHENPSCRWKQEGGREMHLTYRIVSPTIQSQVFTNPQTTNFWFLKFENIFFFFWRGDLYILINRKTEAGNKFFFPGSRSTCDTEGHVRPLPSFCLCSHFTEDPSGPNQRATPISTQSCSYSSSLCFISGCWSIGDIRGPFYVSTFPITQTL